MTKIGVRQIQYALGALMLGGLAAAALFTPARAMVERAATGAGTQHTAGSTADTVTQASSGVISIQVLPSFDGPPPPAARFYGSLKGINSGSTTVSAVGSNGATCGSASVSAATYALDITGTDATCTSSGATVHFLINGKTASAKAEIPPVSAAVHTDLATP